MTPCQRGRPPEGAERPFEGRNAEGGFRAGGLKVGKVPADQGSVWEYVCRTVSTPVLSPLPDRTLQEVPETVPCERNREQRWYRVYDALCRDSMIGKGRFRLPADTKGTRAIPLFCIRY